MLNVHRFVNSYKEANTFVIEMNDTEVFIIDVGSNYSKEIKEWLTRNKKKICGVILTHEHADHCCGVNELLEDFKIDIYCNEKCAVNIKSATQNFSRYTDEIDTFTLDKTPILMVEGQDYFLSGKKFEILETPGHSPGSICIIHENQIFTGDTLLNNLKTPLGFPHSNKIEYSQSLEKIFIKIEKNFQIFPGHGLPFQAKDLNLSLIY
jgi:glyoxylase-like metal-dependent hydrolase (beta-lactamase superfamily II)